MSYWGAQVIINLFDTIPLGRPGAVDLDPRRLRDRRRHAEPLLRAARDCGAAGVAGTGDRAHLRAARRRVEQSGRRRNQGSTGCAGAPAGRHPVSPVLHGARSVRPRILLHGLLRGAVLRAGAGRGVPRGQQLHSGRPAPDAAAHRAALVFHAVLLDPAGHHRGVHVLDRLLRGVSRRPDRAERAHALAALGGGGRHVRRVLVDDGSAAQARSEDVGCGADGPVDFGVLRAAVAGPVAGQVDALPAPWHKALLGGFVVAFLVLGCLGMLPPSPGRTVVSQLCAAYLLRLLFPDAVVEPDGHASSRCPTA